MNWPDPRAAMLLLAALVGIAGASCGGGQSREEYVNRANGVCSSAEENLRQLVQSQTIPNEGFIRQAEAQMNSLIERLRALDTPDDVQPQVNTMLTNFQGAVDQFDALLKAAEKKDTARIQELGRSIREQVDKANAAALDIGLRRCATSTTG